MLHISENGEFRHLMPEIPFLKLAFNISFAFILSSGIRTAPIFWSRLFPDVPREPLQSCGNVVVDVHERELRFFHELSHVSVKNYILFSPFFSFSLQPLTVLSLNVLSEPYERTSECTCGRFVREEGFRGGQMEISLESLFHCIRCFAVTSLVLPLGHNYSLNCLRLSSIKYISKFPCLMN